MSNKVDVFEQKEVDLINHSVKPGNLELLQFFYPNFKVIDTDVMILDGPVIYTGPTEYLNKIKSFGYPVISVTTLGEFNLSDPRVLVNMTYTKWNQKVSDRLAKYVDKLEYWEILQAVKIHWVTGKWTIKKYNKSGAFLTLAESFNTDTHNVLVTYFNLLENKYNTAAYMEKSILSFLEKIASGSTDNSYWYNRILKHYKKGKRKLLEQAIDKYIRVNIWNKDLKVFNLLQDLNRVDKNWLSE